MPSPIVERFCQDFYFGGCDNERCEEVNQELKEKIEIWLGNELSRLAKEVMTRIDEQEKVCDESHPYDSYGCVNGIRVRVSSFFKEQGITKYRAKCACGKYTEVDEPDNVDCQCGRPLFVDMFKI
jgi:hypothetical protein